MSTFSELYDAAKRGWLIIVDGGLCRFRLRRDNIITIAEILVLPTHQNRGIGTRILNHLLTLGADAIVAKCPAELAANRWYKKRGFKKVATEQGRNGEIYTWRFGRVGDRL